MFVINLNFCLLNLNICILALFASGVESFDVEMKEQKVTVKGNVTPDAVLQTVSKTGKKTSFWESEPESNQSKTSASAC
jgi:copper chaperone